MFAVPLYDAIALADNCSSDVLTVIVAFLCQYAHFNDLPHHVRNVVIDLDQTEGMEALLFRLGHVGAERFIALLGKEPFDCTEWRKTGPGQDMDVKTFDYGRLYFYIS